MQNANYDIAQVLTCLHNGLNRCYVHPWAVSKD